MEGEVSANFSLEENISVNEFKEYLSCKMYIHISVSKNIISAA